MWLLEEAGVNQNNNKYQRFVKWFIKRAREIQNGYKKNALFKKRQIKKK
jgi:DNA-directed RNA polymerase subunit K/omega